MSQDSLSLLPDLLLEVLASKNKARKGNKINRTESLTLPRVKETLYWLLDTWKKYKKKNKNRMNLKGTVRNERCRSQQVTYCRTQLLTAQNSSDEAQCSSRLRMRLRTWLYRVSTREQCVHGQWWWLHGGYTRDEMRCYLSLTHTHTHTLKTHKNC